MRKLPRNAGLNQDAETYTCISRPIESAISVYLEVAENWIYLDVLGADRDATFPLTRAEAERLRDGLNKLIPQVHR